VACGPWSMAYGQGVSGSATREGVELMVGGSRERASWMRHDGVSKVVGKRVFC